MSPDTSSAPHIFLACEFSDRGKLSALRQGILPQESATFSIEPDHPCWQRAVELEPEVFDGNAELKINRYWSVRYANLKIEDDFCSDVSVWRYPTAYLYYADPDDRNENELVPLDEYVGIEELLEVEASNRARAEEQLAKAEHHLRDTVRPKWREWIRSQVDLWPHLAETWLTEPALKESDSLPKPITVFLDENVHVDLDVLLGEEDEEWYSKILLDNYVNADVAVEKLKREYNQSEAERQFNDECREWVSQHGSPRLRKALAQKVLKSCIGAYRDERLKLERRGFDFMDDSDRKNVKTIVNPSEQALDLLIESRNVDETMNLRWYHDGKHAGPVIVGQFLDKAIINKSLVPGFENYADYGDEPF